MNTVLVILWLVGVGMFLAGVGGFIDGRKVDRRFKTGYKNNAPDTRDFRRSAKRTLWGVGICLVAMIATALTASGDHERGDRSSSLPVPASSSSTSGLQADVAETPASSGLVEIPQSDDNPASASVTTLSTNERVIEPPLVAVSPARNNASATAVPAPTENVLALACTNDGTFFGDNVCRDAALAAIYQRELTAYQAAQTRLGGADAGVSIEQDRWLATVTHDCGDAPCLMAAFDKRTADLDSRYRGG